MRIYTGELEQWELRSWVPACKQPCIVFKYSLEDLAGGVSTQPTKLAGSQYSGQLVKSHCVTRASESHRAKRHFHKGGDTIRRWWS